MTQGFLISKPEEKKSKDIKGRQKEMENPPKRDKYIFRKHFFLCERKKGARSSLAAVTMVALSGVFLRSEKAIEFPPGFP